MSTAQQTPSDHHPEPEGKGSVAATISTQAWETIRALQRPGQPDLLGKILGMFVTQSQEMVETLRRAIEQHDAQTVFRTAHTLKSSSANVGAAGLAEHCKTLEAFGRQNQLGSAPNLLTQLEAEYGAVLTVLHAELKKNTGT